MQTKKSKRILPRSAVLTLLLLVAAGLSISAFSLALSGWNGVSWAGNPTLFFWNTLPVFLLLGLIWLASGQAWLACLVTGALIFLLTGANYFKVMFRDDPMLWEDLFRMREGLQMSDQYQVALTPMMFLWIGVIVAATVVLFFLGRGRPKATLRLLALTAVGMVSLVCFDYIYPDDQRYTALAGEHAQDEREAYAATGVVYPFFHSAGDYLSSSSSYDERAARQTYNQYTDGVIPPEKKVNLISIQMEAFADLSLYDIDGLSPEVYRDFHELQAESYSGTLITDIFAGGTTETEWAVLTGGNQHGDFKTKTDSVAWYLKSQGYTANGSHPCRDWFYDRKHVNPNLGLDDYLFTDNYYYQFIEEGEDVAYDEVFFPDLQQRLTEYFNTNDAPLFSFNVTYQGHGPYDTDRTWYGDGWVVDDGSYTQEELNLMNNYFGSLKNTGDNLETFFNYFRESKDPVVIVLFGDHNPWMGDANSVYNKLGIDLDLSTKEGFMNYYATRYLIWANDAAKEVLGCDFQGEGPDLSPNFLMTELFDLCGWEGPAFMQATRPVIEALPVINTPTGLYFEDGNLTKDLTDEDQALADRYDSLQYYWRKHFAG